LELAETCSGGYTYIGKDAWRATFSISEGINYIDMSLCAKPDIASKIILDVAIRTSTPSINCGDYNYQSWNGCPSGYSRDAVGYRSVAGGFSGYCQTINICAKGDAHLHLAGNIDINGYNGPADSVYPCPSGYSTYYTYLNGDWTLRLCKRSFDWCDPTNVTLLGRIYPSGAACTYAGIKTGLPSNCTLGNFTGAEPTTARPVCCSGGFFDSTTGQDGKCYITTPAAANKYSNSCALAVRGSVLESAEDIFLEDESNACCGNDGTINPSFENGLNWNLGLGHSISTDKKISGSNSLKATSAVHANSTSNAMTFISGEKYTLSGYIFRDETSSGDALLQINNSGVVLCEAKSSVKGRWERVNCTFTTSSSLTLPVRILTGGAAPVWFDDIYVLGPGLDIGTLSVSDNGENICTYDNGWKWTSASLAGNAYKINPVDGLYDTVSNGQAWFSCDINNVGAPPPDFTQSIFQTLWDAQDGCSVYSQECQNIFDLAGDSSSSPGPSGVLDLDEELPADLFLADIQIEETTIAPVISTDSTSGTAKISVLPSQGNGNQNFQILVRGKEGFNSGDTISENKIRLGDKPTNHSAITIDGSGKFPLTGLSLSQLDPGNYSINITTDQGSSYLFDNSFEVIEGPVHEAPDVPNSVRFMCFDKAGYGELQECAGYSYASALNSNLKKVRRVAETSAILENFGGTSQNNVRRILVQITNPAAYTFSAGKFIVNEPFKITEWSSYDYFEFDSYLSVSDTYLRFYNKTVTKTDMGNINIANEYYQQFRILDYSIDGGELNSWHRIRIPMSQIIEVPTSMGFFIDGLSAKNEIFDAYGTFTPFTFLGNQISIILGFDNIHLTRDSELGQKRFCSSWGEWIEDLDLDFLACENTVSTKWTSSNTLESDSGNYGPCCGDDQARAGNLNESYVGDIAGCWQGKFAANNTPVRENTLLFSDEVFLTCLNASLSSDLKPTSEITSDVSNDNVACNQRGAWYCSLDSRWKSAFIYSQDEPISSIKNETVTSNGNDITTSSTPLACCPSNYCFNGTSCERFYDNPKKLPIYRNMLGQVGYRCSEEGQWANVTIKSDFNRNDTGYCNEESSCYAEGRCYKTGEWNVFNGIDRMCSNGNWTTRAKYLAAELLNYAENKPEYSLFCDEPQTSLGEGVDSIDYSLTAQGLLGSAANPYLGISAAGTLTGTCKDKNGNNIRCVNSFCVFSADEQVIVATSLNRNISAEYPFYQVFEFTENDLETSAQLPNLANLSVLTGDSPIKIFESSRSGVLFYSPGKQTIFYSADTGIIDFNPTFGDQLLYFLTNPIQVTFNAIRNLFAPISEFNEVVNKTADFDRIYFAKKGAKEIVGIQETRFTNVTGQLTTILAVSYKNFASNLSIAAEEANLNYNSIADTQFIFGESSSRTAFNNIWPDLTAKIRIK
jgi:hypothetical protein